MICSLNIVCLAWLFVVVFILLGVFWSTWGHVKLMFDLGIFAPQIVWIPL